MAESKTKHRSPSSPYLTLEDAIGVMEKVYKHERRNAVPVSVVVQHAGYKDLKSSSALRLLATLKQYDLVEDTGSSDARQMKVSDWTLDILLSETLDSPKRLEAIRHCALFPAVHERILQEFPDQLPSDATLKNFLIRVLDFNDDQVDVFIGKFRKTVEFAGLYSANQVEETTEASIENTDGGAMETKTDSKIMTLTDMGMAYLSPTTPRTAPPTSSPSTIFVSDLQGPVVRFDLPRGNLVEIRLRSKLTPNEFKKLKKIFELSELAFVEDPEDDDDLESPTI